MFLRIFDAQNFLRVFLIILVISFKMSWGPKHKMLKLAIKGIWKKQDFFKKGFFKKGFLQLMWPNPQFPHLLKKSLMENFIFCAVK